MERITQHVILPVEEKKKIKFTFEGRPLEALENEVISSSLFANGIKVFSEHKKDGSPQGIFCANGQCAQCTVIADGSPVKACVARVRDGMALAPLKGSPSLPKAPCVTAFGRAEELDVDALIIGGGPAGLAAAAELGKLNVGTLIIDDKHKLGGKLVLQTHKFFGSVEDCYAGTRGIDIADKLQDRLGEYPSVKIWLNATAVAVFSDKKVGVLYGDKYFLIRPRALVRATGAREGSLAFPGNTLPGVYGAGAFQTLVNRDLVRPAQRLFIVGGGNVGLIAAYHALQAGIKVVGLIEAMPQCGGYKVHADKIKRLGVPIYTRHTILRADGKKELETVTIARVDDSFKPAPHFETHTTKDVFQSAGPVPQSRPAAAKPVTEAAPVKLRGEGETGFDALFGSGPGPGRGSGPGGGKAAEGPGGGKAAESVLANMSFGGILKGLVESAVKDPKDRVRAYEDAMKMLRETMEQQVVDSTRALAAEKEQALNTRARTERVLSKVADGKVIVDKDGKILMMNPAAEEIAGTKFADAAGRHISEQLRPGEHVLTLSKDMDISDGKIISGEVEVKGDEPMGRALRRSVAMLVDADGRVVGELSTLPEITKYKEAQRMQDEFLSRVTHDLQSPLSSIASALEMLNDAAANKLDPVENKFLDISIRNSHRLSQMIRGILDFSKLQSGKMDVHPEPAQVAPMLAEAGEGLMPWAKTKGITLTVRPVSQDLYALADPTRIVQVLTNLISNAIKATPEGGAVSVAAAPHPGEGGTVLFGVRDTGHGIPKEDLDRIFEKFVQLPSHQSQEGVGLGLAIVTDFVKLHNGRIWAVSEAGKGSTFYFTLPLAEKKPEIL